MVVLTGKQKNYLRGLGQKLRPVCIIGKSGLTDSLGRNISALLEQHELIKVRLPAGPGDERQAMSEELAAASGAACVGVVGRTALLYRANETLRPEARLVLP